MNMSESLSEKIPHPGKGHYPDLPKRLGVKVDEQVQAFVENGRVMFGVYNEDLGDTVVVGMSEWDFGNFVDTWLDARLDVEYLEREE
jgi:hypothetical protein